jgi:hypothetical protein
VFIRLNVRWVSPLACTHGGNEESKFSVCDRRNGFVTGRTMADMVYIIRFNNKRKKRRPTGPSTDQLREQKLQGERKTISRGDGGRVEEEMMNMVKMYYSCYWIFIF